MFQPVYQVSIVEEKQSCIGNSNKYLASNIHFHVIVSEECGQGGIGHLRGSWAFTSMKELCYFHLQINGIDVPDRGKILTLFWNSINYYLCKLTHFLNTFQNTTYFQKAIILVTFWLYLLCSQVHNNEIIFRSVHLTWIRSWGWALVHIISKKWSREFGSQINTCSLFSTSSHALPPTFESSLKKKKGGKNP